MTSALKKTGSYCRPIVKTAVLRIRQAVYQNQQKFFSPFAVDKPVEKQIFFELPHCFLTKNYDLPKK